jgi:type VI protein secretion system component VasK
VLKQMADNFRDFRNEGMDTVVSSLLEEPINLAGPLLTIKSPVSQKNGELMSQVCSPMRPILVKYPFHHSTKDADVSLPELETWFAPNTGKIWKYATGSGAELVVFKGGQWVPNPMLQDMKVSPELLTFLNGAQMLTKAFFADGRTKPGFTYKLRPAAGQSIAIQLKLDGVELGKTFQTDFSWPATSGSSVAEGTAIRPDGSSQPFGRYTDLWAVFRLFDAAAPREPNAKDVQWDKVRGDGGQLQPFSPPVKVEILSFPGGVDVFQPGFFESVRQCAKKAVDELKQ